jgi:hypothetical protein
MDEVIKALSLRQRWAWLVARGFKPIENRPWTTNFRGRFLIHASKSEEQLDGLDEGWIIERLEPRQVAEYRTARIDYGAIIGAGTVVDCVDSAYEILRRYRELYDVRWFTGPHGLVIAEAVLYERPVPCRGALGFFIPELTKENLELLEAQRAKYG